MSEVFTFPTFVLYMLIDCLLFFQFFLRTDVLNRCRKFGYRKLELFLRNCSFRRARYTFSAAPCICVRTRRNKRQQRHRQRQMQRDKHKRLSDELSDTAVTNCIRLNRISLLAHHILFNPFVFPYN